MKPIRWLAAVLGTAALAAGLRADEKSVAVAAVVAADGSGEFRSVQEAINAAPQLTTAADTWTIRIKPGTYRELIYVMREKRFIRLVGDNPATTIIAGDRYAGIPGADGQPIGTFRTPTMWVDADDFTVEGLTIANTAGAVGQAVALRVDGDRDTFRNCTLTGWQDTLLCNRGRQYFDRCRISGAVDFIFGGATAFFLRCQLVCTGEGYITAASTLPEDAYGFVFDRCQISGANAAVRTYLGRPWRSYASVAFVDSEMSAVVRPEGWHNWDRPDREKTSRFVELGSTGPGAPGRHRVAWASAPAVEEAKRLTPGSVLGGRDGWMASAR